MSRYREARSGFTLTEVLMAMFVMAIGMISLLALFPVAFQNAKWALDNEQVARAARNSQVQTETPRIKVDMPTPLAPPVVSTLQQSMRNDQMYNPDLSNNTMCWKFTDSMSTQLSRRDFLINTTLSPNQWTFDWNVNQAGIISGSKVQLPPVFVDPQVADSPAFQVTFTGVTGKPAILPFHVGVLPGTPAQLLPFSNIPISPLDTATFRPRRSLGIPRTTTSQFSNIWNTSEMAGSGIAIRRQNEFSQGDEIDFGLNGQPILNGTTYGRQRRFTWAYLCRWPDYNSKEVCDVAAIVFNSRPDSFSTLPPGETTYGGNTAAAAAAGTDTLGFGRIFVKGLNQGTIALPSAQPLPLRVNDWIMDSTFILPEYNENFPTEKAPFLDQYDPMAMYPFPVGTIPPARFLRPGLVGGHFYKVIDIGPLQNAGGVFFQTITIDRPAKSDGFSATVLAGVADVITKSVGRMPHR